MTVTSAEVLATFADGKPAMTRNRFGKGEAIVAGLWSGLTYSARVRRNDFDMRADYDATLRSLIAAPAFARNVYRLAVPSDPLVEAIALNRGEQRSVAIINWSYRRADGDAGKGVLQSIENLRVELPGFVNTKSARSIIHGPLTLNSNAVILPQLEEIDLLVLE